MTHPKTVVKSVGPLLVPFFKTVAVHFVLFPGKTPNNLWYMLFKCAPICCLIGFIIFHGMNLSEVYSYSRRILIGLVFSLIGDALLVFDGFFLPGLVMFACAQLVYASAFGFKPVGFRSGAVCSMLAAISFCVIFPKVKEPVMLTAGALYTFLIFLMVWRAVMRVQFFNDLWTWTKLCSFVGAVSFVVSDLTLAINKFVCPVPFSDTIIMATYYFAQMGITVSVVDSQVDKVIELSLKNNNDLATQSSNIDNAKTTTKG